MENIVVMFGGKSFEHDVSIITGLQIINNVNKLKYKVYPVYITKNGDYLYSDKFKDIKTFKNFDESKYKKVFFKPNDSGLYFSKIINKKVCNVDAVILGTHGGNGEDGTICAVLDESKIPYTASGMAGSVMAMDKVLTKQILECEQLPTLEYKVLKKSELTEVNVDLLPTFPLIIKPSHLGSSIGVTLVNNVEELASALEVAFTMDDIILVEKALTDFYELNIALYKNKENIEVSEIEKPVKLDKILTFENKYISQKNKAGMESLEREYPANISEELKKEVIETSKKAFNAFSLSGICRIDFMFDNVEGKLYLNEINSIPGSLAFYLFKNKFTFSELLDELIENAKLNAVGKRFKKFNYNSSILDNVDFGGVKK